MDNNFTVYNYMEGSKQKMPMKEIIPIVTTMLKIYYTIQFSIRTIVRTIGDIFKFTAFSFIYVTNKF